MVLFFKHHLNFHPGIISYLSLCVCWQTEGQRRGCSTCKRCPEASHAPKATNIFFKKLLFSLFKWGLFHQKGLSVCSSRKNMDMNNVYCFNWTYEVTSVISAWLASSSTPELWTYENMWYMWYLNICDMWYMWTYMNICER